MIKHIYNEAGTELIKSVEAIPKHMEDFCDSCGDCLDCYGSDPCADGDFHLWVQYGDDPEPKEQG